MRGTALATHLSLRPLSILTVTKVRLAKSVNQTGVCLHANSPTTGHNLSIPDTSILSMLVTTLRMYIKYLHSQRSSSGFPITNPSTTLLCQLKQPFPPALAWTFCSIVIWVSYNVKGQEKYKKQEQKFQSFGGNLSLLQNLDMQFSTFQRHIHEAGTNSPFTTNVRVALWGTSDLKLRWFSQNGQSGFI